jgi:antitoxin component of MazEF toxin-antitoxin module
MENDKPTIRRTVYTVGGSSAVTIPKEIVEFIGIVDGDELCFAAEVGKHGKFISMWKKVG